MSDNGFMAHGLTMRFDRKVVMRDLTIELAPGEVTVLLGRNGAGKSTLLKLALGVLKPQAGTLTVAGHDPLRRPALVRRAVGYVPDSPDAYRWMTPAAFLRFLEPHYPSFDRALASELAERLRVPLARTFRHLSRGEGMKAMLVAALAHRPRVLLLDEPFAGLDPLVRDDVVLGVLEALRGGRCTVLCTTHELEVAARLADRVAVLAGGRIERHGTLAELLGAEEPAALPESLREVMRSACAGAP